MVLESLSLEVERMNLDIATSENTSVLSNEFIFKTIKIFTLMLSYEDIYGRKRLIGYAFGEGFCA